jgi:hypothetical protein
MAGGNCDGEEDVMATAKHRLTVGFGLIALMWVGVTAIGCAGSRSSPSLNVIPVASLATIAGEWEGVSKSVPDMRNDAFVMLIIRQEGRFHFISNRRTETLLGTGTLAIDGGTVVAKGSQGHALLALHEKAGGPILVVQAALTNGHHYYIEMTRYKSDSLQVGARRLLRDDGRS